MPRGVSFYFFTGISIIYYFALFSFFLSEKKGVTCIGVDNLSLDFAYKMVHTPPFQHSIRERTNKKKRAKAIKLRTYTVKKVHILHRSVELSKTIAVKYRFRSILLPNKKLCLFFIWAPRFFSSLHSSSAFRFRCIPHKCVVVKKGPLFLYRNYQQVNKRRTKKNERRCIVAHTLNNSQKKHERYNQ